MHGANETARRICARLDVMLDRMPTARELRAWMLLIAALSVAWTAIILAYD
jgi:hypothetical protein